MNRVSLDAPRTGSREDYGKDSNQSRQEEDLQAKRAQVGSAGNSSHPGKFQQHTCFNYRSGRQPDQPVFLRGARVSRIAKRNPVRGATSRHSRGTSGSRIGNAELRSQSKGSGFGPRISGASHSICRDRSSTHTGCNTNPAQRLPSAEAKTSVTRRRLEAATL